MSTQMMPAHRTCAECDRVWENYTQAVVAHLKIVAERHKAALHEDPALLDELAETEAELAERQIRLRRAIDYHEAAHTPVRWES